MVVNEKIYMLNWIILFCGKRNFFFLFVVFYLWVGFCDIFCLYLYVNWCYYYVSFGVRYRRSFFWERRYRNNVNRGFFE